MIKYSFILIIAAGLMNASFVIPIRRINNMSNEMIWFFHSIFGLLLIPWILFFTVMPHSFGHYFALGFSSMTWLILGGLVFGLGQVFFSYAIRKIGIALSFTINLGLGVTIGSLFVILLKGLFFTTRGYFVTLATVLIILGLIFYYVAGQHKQSTYNRHYSQGWLLAIFTGITSGLQNITFVVVAFHSDPFKTGNPFWVWPPFLLMASIPMMIGFRHKIKQLKIVQKNKCRLNIRNFALIVLMGLLFTGSLVLYSEGMSQLTHSQQIIGWPCFMVSIILMSQLWGLSHQEIDLSWIKTRCFVMLSLLSMVSAILILGYFQH